MSSQHDDSGKMFVGGLSWETSQDALRDYFSRFGEIVDCVVMKHTETGRSRGFGFVTYKDPACLQTVIASPSHTLDGRTIDPKCCNPKGQQTGGSRPPPRRDNRDNNDRQPRKSDTPKIFVGGLHASTDEGELRNHFSTYGKVVDVVIMYDQEKQRSRGFGFVSFETDDSVDRVCAERYIVISGKQVEAKRAEPRGGGGGGGGGGRGGSRDGGGRDGGGGRYNGNWNGNGHQGGPPTNNGSSQSGGYQSSGGWGNSSQGYSAQGSSYGSSSAGGGYQGWGGSQPSSYGAYAAQPQYPQPAAYAAPGYGYGYGWPVSGAPSMVPPTNSAAALSVADYGATPAAAVPGAHVPTGNVASTLKSSTKQDYNSYSSSYGSDSYSQDAPSYSTTRARGGQDGYNSGSGDSATPSGGGRGGSHSQGAGYHPYKRQ